jgi:hypothetical protein
MFLVTDADANAIRDAYQRDGEFAAAIELRSRFKGIIDNEAAQAHVRAIVGWRRPADAEQAPRPLTKRLPGANRRTAKPSAPER